MPDKFNYYLPTDIYFGAGSIKRLKDLAGTGQKILLVTGRSFLRRTGWLKKVKNQLKGNKVSIYDQVAANPDLATVEQGLALARKHKISLVIGVGGGSVLDCAKAIAILAKNKGKVLAYLDKRPPIKNPGLRLIAVPTTAGSSSEVTPYSVITVQDRGIKITLAHKYMYPNAALIDPDFLNSLPPEQVANPGIDVLCHAMEAYWNINNNPISDIFALQAIKLVVRSLPRLYKDRSSKKDQTEMAKASLFAGLAFSNTRTTACHSISYPLTTIFGVPHGQACAITLPEMLIFNARAVKDRARELCRALGAKDVAAAANRIRQLMKQIGLKSKLSELGIKTTDLSIVIDKGYTPEKVAKNPRKISHSQMQKILKRSF
jgi:phosphonate metabolism-associated iron-containing alcohol dehydrogenase